MNKVLAIIPARGGSKGVPNKNIRPLNGKPLIAWTIDEAKKSKYISELVVSTDDLEIRDVAEAYGCDVPLLRPQSLATDTSPIIDTVLHLLTHYSERQMHFDYVLLLQCTSPLRTVEDIDDALTECFRRDLNSMVSVCETEHSPYWYKKIDSNGIMSNIFQDDVQHTTRQQLPKTYRLNGALYIAKSECLVNNRSFYTDRTTAYVMSSLRSIDIDTMIDFEIAEILMRKSVEGGL
ncbi:acylneuraminate cytidylyltransferase family protein [Paenibacillus thermotolerans]|uniref:acylneuraminate cytidylyltransferase family protein n=1 Tax=Paenibacillus thermotolerans TaxID=3027807 RepID=UPI0030823162